MFIIFSFIISKLLYEFVYVQLCKNFRSNTSACPIKVVNTFNFSHILLYGTLKYIIFAWIRLETTSENFYKKKNQYNTIGYCMKIKNGRTQNIQLHRIPKFGLRFSCPNTAYLVSLVEWFPVVNIFI